MSDDPILPFEAEHDVAAERAARGPLDRRDLVLTVLIGLVGAIGVGVCGAIVVFELLLSTSPADLIPIVLTGAGPLGCWIAGAILAFLRLTRRRRAWPVPLIALGGIVLLGALGTLIWAKVAGVL